LYQSRHDFGNGNYVLSNFIDQKVDTKSHLANLQVLSMGSHWPKLAESGVFR